MRRFQLDDSGQLGQTMIYGLRFPNYIQAIKKDESLKLCMVIKVHFKEGWMFGLDSRSASIDDWAISNVVEVHCV